MKPSGVGSRRNRMRGAVVGVAMGLVLVGCGGDANTSASTGKVPDGDSIRTGGTASCVGPYINKPLAGRGKPSGPPPSKTVSPGDRVQLRGHWYSTTCNDRGEWAPLRPLPDVILTVRLPNGKELRAGPFTPQGRDMGFRTEIEVPIGTPAGRVTVTDNVHDYPVYAFTVVARSD